MWYLYPKMVEQGLRFEQPYQERLLRVGKELERRLHEHGITWWDKQLAEYEALPHWRDLSALWEDAHAKHFKVQIADYPFWLVTSRSMQYSWGNNVGVQLIKEVADNEFNLNIPRPRSSASPTATWSKCARRSTAPKAR